MEDSTKSSHLGMGLIMKVKPEEEEEEAAPLRERVKLAAGDGDSGPRPLMLLRQAEPSADLLHKRIPACGSAGELSSAEASGALCPGAPSSSVTANSYPAPPPPPALGAGLLATSQINKLNRASRVPGKLEHFYKVSVAIFFRAFFL